MNLLKQTTPWLLVPLCMTAAVFGIVCAVDGVDLTVEREGDCVKVGTLNNTYQCAMFQWNTTLDTNGWNDYHGYFASTGETPCRVLNFSVTANNNRVFWRLRDCAVP